jgi:hypothetical protein
MQVRSKNMSSVQVVRALLTILVSAMVLSSGSELLAQTGEPASWPSGGGGFVKSPVYIDASQAAGADMCAQISTACTTAPFTTTMTTIDARAFVGSQACNSNMFAGCNKSVELLLNPNVLIVASVPQFTPQLPHKIDGGIAGNLAATGGATITACGPASPAGANWTGSCAPTTGGAVAQFGTTATNAVKFTYQHGKFPAGTYFCLICGGGESGSLRDNATDLLTHRRAE